METSLFSMNETYDKINIPLRPHITDDQKPVTEKEMENRIRVVKELDKLGISISKFDAEDEHEDADELQAILLVNQGKKIPKDLKERLMDKQKKDFDKKRTGDKAVL